MIIAVLLVLVLPGHALFNVVSFAKQLYIPGQYFSLMNFSKNTAPLQNYYDVRIDYTLAQAMFADQGNSIFDFFLLQKNQYEQMEPCYYQTVVYLNNLYAQFQPCQGYAFLTQRLQLRGLLALRYQLDLPGPLGRPVRQPVPDRRQHLLPLQRRGLPERSVPLPGAQPHHRVQRQLPIRHQTRYHSQHLVFVILLQVFIFLFAYIVIMLQKLQSKKKRLKKLKQEEEDQEVLYSLERDRENH